MHEVFNMVSKLLLDIIFYNDTCLLQHHWCLIFYWM